MTNIVISNKVIGVTMSGHQRLNKYTDEQLATFVERCAAEPRHWHVMFRHRGIQGARQKVFRVNHTPRFANLPLDYKAIRTPNGLVDTAAYDVGGYVVARYSKNKKRLQTRVENFLDLSALSEAKLIELLGAIESAGVFKVPESALSTTIGYVEPEVTDDEDVYGEMANPDASEDETAHLLSSPVNAERLEDSMQAVARGEYQERDLIDIDNPEGFDDIF